MPANQAPVWFEKVLTIAAITQSANSSTFTLPVADSYSFYLQITSCGTTSLNVGYLTSYDKGTTFVPIPLVHTAVTTTTITDVLTVRLGLGYGEIGTVSGLLPNAGGSTAVIKNCVFDPQYMYARYTVSGSPWTGAIYVACVPRSPIY